jgi:glycosyltransferase involved in cell wall biosynthesis
VALAPEGYGRQTLKLALIADQLLEKAGSERVFQYVCEEFPEADAFAFVHSRETTFPYFKHRNVRTPRISALIRNRKSYEWSFPLATYAMQSLPLHGYDAVLSCSATVAKYVRPGTASHLCYCYIPTRALWQTDAYFGSGAKGRLLRPMMGFLRRRDARAAARVDAFLTISRASQDHITRCYGRKSDILYCPIDTDQFRPTAPKEDHFLIVARLVRWKRVDYAVEAFKRLNYPLRIVGTGPEEEKLRALAGPRTEFLGNISDSSLADEYSKARAVVFTPFIEGGMTPVEANACGTPTICLGAGGVTELQIDHTETAERGAATSVFFYEQTPEAVTDAVRAFEKVQFDSEAIVRHADQYSVPRFKKRMRQFVENHVR